MDGDKVTREFIILPEFEKQWKSMELTDDDLKSLQEELTINPQKGDVMQGTGGLRKMRISLENRGKSSGARVCYVDFTIYDKIYLITAYPKNAMENLSKEQRNAIKAVVKELEKTLYDRRAKS